MPDGSSGRAAALDALREQALACVRCPQLVSSRTQVVFGSGSPDADLMFVGEAPGVAEDRAGTPFAAEAGRLLDTLLAEIDLTRADVALTSLVCCRPPENRPPRGPEQESCLEYLLGQIELVAPVVVCPLGNFATRVLRRAPEPITRVHGAGEVMTLGSRAVRLYPLFHPVAALYTPANLELLRADMARLPALLALGAPEQPVAEPPDDEERVGDGHEAGGQLELF